MLSLRGVNWVCVFNQGDKAGFRNKRGCLIRGLVPLVGLHKNGEGKMTEDAIKATEWLKSKKHKNLTVECPWSNESTVPREVCIQRIHLMREAEAGRTRKNKLPYGISLCVQCRDRFINQ